MLLFIPIILLLRYDISNSSQHSYANPAALHQKYTQEKTADSYPKPAIPPRRVRIAEKAPTASDNTTRTNDTGENTLYRSYLWATIIGVAVAIVGLVFLIKSATAARDNARAIVNSERAWIFADMDSPPLHSLRTIETRRKKTMIDAEVACRNVGRSPAWITEVRLRFMSIEADKLPSEPRLDEAEQIWSGTQPIAPEDQPFRVPAYGLSANGIQGIDSITGELFIIYGVIRYRDIYSPDRAVTFGFRLMPGTDTRFTRLIGFPKYNENT